MRYNNSSDFFFNTIRKGNNVQRNLHETFFPPSRMDAHVASSEKSFLKKNLNASKPSEHPPDGGGNCNCQNAF